jgi:hypothetical protein
MGMLRGGERRDPNLSIVGIWKETRAQSQQPGRFVSFINLG